MAKGPCSLFFIHEDIDNRSYYCTTPLRTVQGLLTVKALRVQLLSVEAGWLKRIDLHQPVVYMWISWVMVTTSCSRCVWSIENQSTEEAFLPAGIIDNFDTT